MIISVLPVLPPGPALSLRRQVHIRGCFTRHSCLPSHGGICECVSVPVCVPVRVPVCVRVLSEKLESAFRYGFCAALGCMLQLQLHGYGFLLVFCHCFPIFFVVFPSLGSHWLLTPRLPILGTCRCVMGQA